MTGRKIKEQRERDERRTKTLVCGSRNKGRAEAKKEILGEKGKLRNSGYGDRRGQSTGRMWVLRLVEV